MTANAIANALGDARREGRAWRCRCPVHGGRSLLIRDGDHGLLVTCWGGCDRLDVLTELRRRGLIAGRANFAPRVTSASGQDDESSRSQRALTIWRGARDGADTIVRRYLASRGIRFDQWPNSLRFHPQCPRPRDDAGNSLPPLPARVGLIEHVLKGAMGVHCTFLRADGSGKAEIEKPKAMFGPMGGGAVRFGWPRADRPMAVAEGLETALSVAVRAQSRCGRRYRQTASKN
jgi:putative DNA primase/helicase